MFANERQNEIYRMILRDGAVTTTKLVELFCVSVETIRRDLLFMEHSRKLKRVHGGAVVLGEMKNFPTLELRNLEMNEEKRELTVVAAECVNEGDHIGIDSGSTAIFFAEALKEKFSSLTVITYSSDVFEILRNHADFKVILCGGNYVKEENAFCGPLTLAMIELLHIKKMFLCPSAVSMKYGICDYQQDLFMLQKAMLKISDEIYVMADSSKFEGRALLKIDDMRSDYFYITDGKLSNELKEIYSENNIKIISK